MLHHHNKDTVRICKHTPGATSRVVLTILLMKRRTLGISACLRFSLVRALCVLFFGAKHDSNDRKLGDLGR